ncbi:hypothetical protein EVAR_59164_1 [Eumeta japonica]|uniref:Uncharacterized protein n=1 Tax=Eumeta variegata TaxID=151549 RepID=A0A4C1YW90_EUMVA|nr:hypothetical protein EVAR_59164_1 [Eumeta japonica]
MSDALSELPIKGLQLDVRRRLSRYRQIYPEDNPSYDPKASGAKCIYLRTLRDSSPHLCATKVCKFFIPTNSRETRRAGVGVCGLLHRRRSGRMHLSCRRHTPLVLNDCTCTHAETPKPGGVSVCFLRAWNVKARSSCSGEKLLSGES